MVYEELFAVEVSGEASYAVVHSDDVGVKAADEVIESRERSDLSAGCNVDVHAECGNAGIRVEFRIGMDCDVALIEMSDYLVAAGRYHSIVSDQEGRGSSLRIVVLT